MRWEGSTFIYWKGSTYPAGAKYKVTEDHTFTAQWAKNTPKDESKDPDKPGDGGEQNGADDQRDNSNRQDGGADTKTDDESNMTGGEGNKVADEGSKMTDEGSETGDESSVLGWMILLVIALSVMAAVLTVNRRSRRL